MRPRGVRGNTQVEAMEISLWVRTLKAAGAALPRLLDSASILCRRAVAKGGRRAEAYVCASYAGLFVSQFTRWQGRFSPVPGRTCRQGFEWRERDCWWHWPHLCICRQTTTRGPYPPNIATNYINFLGRGPRSLADRTSARLYLCPTSYEDY
jgi:hypothetical protein